MERLKNKYNSFKELLKNLINKGAVHVFIGNFVTKFAGFFASMFIIRLFSKSDYGVLGYVENLFGYIYLLAGFGLTNALFRYVVLAKTEEQKYTIYNHIIKKSTVINIILVIISASVFMFIYPHSQEFVQAKWLLPLLILSLPFHSLTDSGTAAYRAMFDARKYALFSCSIAVTVLLFKYIFSKYFGLPGAFASNIILYFVWSVILLIFVRRNFFKKLKSSVLDKLKRREIDSYSFQYMITNGLWVFFMLNDIFLLGQFTGDSALVADFKVAHVLPANLSLFSSSIGVFIAPFFIKNEKNTAWVRRNHYRSLLTSVILIGASALILGIWAKPIISLLYGASYINIVPLMRILLAASFINNALRYTSANLLASMGYIKANMLVSILGVVLQIGINLYIAPIYGAYGIAYTSVFVYSVMAIVLNIVFIRRYRSPK
ncbi:MAG: polysaccharide biosynthesis C-terminal domain-containing protein [Clostridiales bacterium]|jgi:O-antigen/teichoic acid export membrane protein|nr:polysaccharide biosynthesis C-terminal domain-containing protein [Clostridiales bacterium]